MSMTSITVEDSQPTDSYSLDGAGGNRRVSDTPVVAMANGSTATGSAAVAIQGGTYVADLMQLIKPRISSMVLVTVALACFVGSGGHPSLWTMLHCLIGTALVAASSGAFNQWLEQSTDARMRRTQNRPLPSGRMSVAEVIGFGIATLIAGVTYLLLTVGLVPTLWSVATWLAYVCVYTPMKLRTSWNTTVGAISGALPILIGASAVQQTMSWQIVTMLCVLFLWQFPHFIAIAWIYRKEYAKAKLVMVTTTDPTGKMAGRYSVLGAVALFATSFLPLLSPMSLAVAVLFSITTLALGIYQLNAAINFYRKLDDLAARKLLKASIIYLPLALGLIAVQTAL